MRAGVRDGQLVIGCSSCEAAEFYAPITERFLGPLREHLGGVVLAGAGLLEPLDVLVRRQELYDRELTIVAAGRPAGWEFSYVRGQTLVFLCPSCSASPGAVDAAAWAEHVKDRLN